MAATMKKVIGLALTLVLENDLLAIVLARPFMSSQQAHIIARKPAGSSGILKNLPNPLQERFSAGIHVLLTGLIDVLAGGIEPIQLFQ